MTDPTFETLSETEWAQVERIRELLDEGEVEEARTALDGLLRRRPGHPDLRILDATLHLEDGEAQEALEALQGAERSADPAQFFYLRADASFDLVRFDDAKRDAEQAITIYENFGHAWELLSRVLDHQGDAEAAREAAERASEIDDEAFPLPLEVPHDEFDALVESSLKELPEP